MAFINIAGGYWTGSSAIVDLLSEHSQCRVIDGEYCAFSYGQLFEDALRPFYEGDAYHAGWDATINQLLGSLQKEPVFPVFKIARRLTRSAGLYPRFLYLQRLGYAQEFGEAYSSDTIELAHLLKESPAHPDGQPRELVGNVVKRLLSHLENPGKTHTVLDQMISPPYVQTAHAILPDFRHVFVDRDWRDQYMFVRDILQHLIRKNSAVGLRPWAEEYDRLVGKSVQDIFVYLRHEIGRAKSGRSEENVLWIEFEDIIHHPKEVSRTVQDHCQLSYEEWKEGGALDPSKSLKNIGLWKKLSRTDPIYKELEYVERSL